MEEVAGEIAAMGGKAVAIQADASLEQQINMLIDTVTPGVWSN